MSLREGPPAAPATAEFARTAGEIAHDVNNLLTAVLGYANLLGKSFADDDPRRTDVAEIISAAQQAGELAHRLLVMSGRRPPVVNPQLPGTNGVQDRSAAAAAPDRVLVVEDDRAVRYLVRTILSQAGYDVREASSPAAAEAWLAEHAGTLQMLITDVVLPGGNGPDLYRRAAQKCPTLKVLYMSGYTDQEIQRERLLDPGAPFIQKPFSGEELSAKVRELLAVRL